jgi:hypothetical protein
MESNEIEYRYVRGSGWVAGYRDSQPISTDHFEKILDDYLRYGVIMPNEVRTFRFTTITGVVAV